MSVNRIVACTKMARYYDIGFNISDAMYRGVYNGSVKHAPDVSNVLQRAVERNVRSVLITGSSISESTQSIQLINSHKKSVDLNLYYTIGVHPCSVNEFAQSSYSTIDKPTHDENYNESLFSNIMNNNGEIRELVKKRISELNDLYLESANDANFKAVGEIGLDYDRLYYSSKEMQMMFFEEQLKLSCLPYLADKPLFLHMRNCCNDFIAILSKFINGFTDTVDQFDLKRFNNLKDDIHYKFNQDRKFVVHSFTDSVEDMNRILDLSPNAYIGMNGASLRDESNIKCAKAVPLDRLLIETDSPWCDIRRTHESYKYLQIPDGTTSQVYELPYKSVKKEKLDKLSEDEKKTTMVKGRNEPCTMEQVAIVISNIKEVKLQEFNETVWKTSCVVYGE